MKIDQHTAIICLRYFGLFLFSLLLTANWTYGQEKADIDYVKSSYILNFLEETTWPQEENVDTFYIGVVDNQSVLRFLQHLSKDMHTKQKPFRVIQVMNTGFSNKCHILYQTRDTYETNVSYQLLVTDKQTATSMISFDIKEEGNIEYKIHLPAFEKSKLKPSAKLLFYGGEKELALETINEIEQILQNQLKTIRERDLIIQEKETKINKLTEKFNETENNIISLKKELELRQTDLSKKDNFLDSLNNLLSRKEKQVSQIQKETSDLEKLNSERQQNLTEMQQELEKKSALVENNNQILEQQKKRIAEHEDQLKIIENKLDKSQKSLWISILVVLIILTLLYVIYKENKQRRKALKLVEQQNEQIKLASAHKDDFIASLSHEVRTPLNAIVGYTNLLLDKVDSTEAKNYLGNILLSSSNLLAIINDILDLKKIESGKIEFESISFDFKQVIKNTFDSLRLQADKKSLSYNMNFDENLPVYIHSDPTRISQVLLNLLSNAIKFTQEGSVTLNVNCLHKSENQASIKFEIVDTGKGIEKEKLGNIFESFIQEDSSITRKYGGTGLGLTISQRIVKLMDGEIKVESELNKGTSFWFELTVPVSKTSKVELDDQKQIVIDNIEHIKIIIADDEPLNRQLLKTQLLTWNPLLNIDLAEDGKELIELYKNNNYDLVLTDIRMPNISGIDATLTLKEINSTVVIIGVSANAIDSDVQECLNAGMNDYITKPINFNQLLISIAKNCGLNYTIQAAEIISTSGPEYFKRLKEICTSEEDYHLSKQELINEIDAIINSLSQKSTYDVIHSLVNKIIYVNDPDLIDKSKEIEAGIRKSKLDRIDIKITELKESWDKVQSLINDTDI